MLKARNKDNRLIKNPKNIGRIGILMGGSSAEREVSLKSGQAVFEALKGLGADVIAIDLKNSSVERNIKEIKKHKIKIAFIALHGQFGEDGTIQRILEENNIPYTGSGVEASALAMDKIASRKIFEKNKLPVPNYLIGDTSILNFGLWSLNGLTYPLVVKPSNQGSSIGISIIEREKDLNNALNLAGKFSSQVIVEEYISGQEITVGILEEKPLPVIQIFSKNKFYDYRAKYQSGKTEYEVPADISKKEFYLAQKKALAAHKALGCRSFSRVDMILKSNSQAVILEVNTIPGLTSTSLLPKAAKAVGISFPQLCLKLINSAL